MMFDELYRQGGFWSTTGPQGDVVLSTRVRLARNLATVPFPHKQDEPEITIVKSVSYRFVHESELNRNALFVEVASLDAHDRRFLRERNIITNEMEQSARSFVIINHDENFVIMINEEDHFRIQVIYPGLQVMDSYRNADRIDTEMNRYVSYAFSDDLGYLTACPSNVGTGLRASAMMHLPALTHMRSIPDVVRAVKEHGADLKATAGEGGKTVGCMYIVQNRVSLGKSEADILEQVDEAASTLIGMENEARDDYVSQYRSLLEDRVWRSFGTVRYARIINYLDCMEHLSNIRLGVVLSVIKNLDLQKINDLMVNVQWSHLQKRAGSAFANTQECDSYRADYVRAAFAQEGP
jgi:protein arginine kinase